MIDWNYVLVKRGQARGRRPRTRLAQLMTRSKRGLPPWEVEVLFFSRSAKHVPKPTRVNVSDVMVGWAWLPSPEELRTARKSLPASF